MIQPLALVLYEKLMPGTQLVNLLQDLNYRVQPLTDASRLAACAQAERPMLVLADLESSCADVCAVIAGLRHEPATAHIPVIAFAPERAHELLAAAREGGATLVVSEAAVISHLAQLLDQALQLE